ncbi:hypothetical protein V2I01_32635 [Micromonospora sp. BRA006-A]|nr:hypothetical protein [Micromonospora sp. BRA006-A]
MRDPARWQQQRGRPPGGRVRRGDPRHGHLRGGRREGRGADRRRILLEPEQSHVIHTPRRSSRSPSSASTGCPGPAAAQRDGQPVADAGAGRD